MSILTIDTKENCYVINASEMNHLQQNVANSITLDRGTYDIKIASGTYKYAKSSSEGEPYVLLWIYGESGATFVNQKNGFETVATWITLNGYNDNLKLEVKQRAVVCGLFFDVNNNENGGSINFAISSTQPGFNPLELTVDSKKNCYVLDENSLSSLKQSGKNTIELNPGTYKIKIDQSNAGYWSNGQKIDLQPRILLWIKGGKLIAKSTGVEVEESWCSLNGLIDEVVIEVKENTTLSGLYFDTSKEDKDGQFVLAIETISGSEFNLNQQLVGTSGGMGSTSTGMGSISTSTTTTSSSMSSDSVGMGSGGEVGISTPAMTTTNASRNKADFNFSFDEAEMEQMWQQMAAKINTSVTLTNQEDPKKEVYWDQLENWILKGYQTQAKNLAMQVARLEFMMKSLTQQTEKNFNENFRAWSGYFDSRLNDLMNTRINSLVEEQINIKINDQTRNIKNLVVQQMRNDLDQRVDSVVNIKIANQNQEIKNQVVQQMQEELEQRIDSVVNLKISNQAPEINNLVVQQIESDIDGRIDNAVNLKISNLSQEINNQVIQQIRDDIDGRIDSVVNLKVTGQTQNIKNLIVQQMQSDMEKRIDAIVNLRIANLGQEINNQVIQQIRNDMDGRIDSVVNLKINDQTQNIKNLVLQQIQIDFDNRINSAVDRKTDNSVQQVVNNAMGDIDNRINVKIENKILNFRDDVSSIVENELSQNIDSIKINILSDIKRQQFYLDMQSIRAEVENFYSRLGQFETQLNLRINQGDTQLYNWTLEQLVEIQGCLTDRQALVEMFDSFSAELKHKLDSAPCVSPNRLVQQQLSPVEALGLPQS